MYGLQLKSVHLLEVKRSRGLKYHNFSNSNIDMSSSFMGFGSVICSDRSFDVTGNGEVPLIQNYIM